MPLGPIDIFCHCLPTTFCEAVERLSENVPWMFSRALRNRALVDIDARLRVLDEFPGYRQVLSLASPSVDQLASGAQAAELARIGNTAMAHWVHRHPERFVGFVAAVPLLDHGRAVIESEYALQELGAVGFQIYSNVNGRPLDDPIVYPIVEHLLSLGRPLWLHPIRTMKDSDYRTEPYSKFDLWWALGWPYETSLAMARLAFTDMFDQHPDAIIIAHHVGGVLPMMQGRLDSGLRMMGTRNPPELSELVGVDRAVPPIDRFSRFYADSASFGSQGAIECGLSFFGEQRLLFASDMPFDPEGGPGYIRSTLAAIEAMTIAPATRDAILFGNAQRILGLQ
ncbi:amidohydrolase family protein [Aeoliella sp. SH292]|uniref:amidohydrolase family protein n=1 Tax=Aeoliella sp. SH292 TaxID=3454464 RepID=UPI003F9936E8